MHIVSHCPFLLVQCAQNDVSDISATTKALLDVGDTLPKLVRKNIVVVISTVSHLNEYFLLLMLNSRKEFHVAATFCQLSRISSVTLFALFFRHLIVMNTCYLYRILPSQIADVMRFPSMLAVRPDRIRYRSFKIN